MRYVPADIPETLLSVKLVEPFDGLPEIATALPNEYDGPKLISGLEPAVFFIIVREGPAPRKVTFDLLIVIVPVTV